MPLSVPAVPESVWNRVVASTGVALISRPVDPASGIQAGASSDGTITQILSEQVLVNAMRVKRNLEDGTVTFGPKVRVVYGPTIILADELVISESRQEATAKGSVVITDPDGTLSAENLFLKFAKGQESATFRNLKGEIAGARITAAGAMLTKGLWTFEDISGTPCRRNPPLLGISGSRLIIEPGKRGKIERPTLFVLGKKIVTAPSYRFNLDKRVQGIGVPTIAYRKDEGVGISWGAAFLLNSQSVGAAFLGVFPKSFPTYGVSYARSFLKPDETEALILPKDELSERFTYSWFETVEVSNPFSETQYFNRKRSSVGVSSQWNRGSVRTGTLRFSKAIDLAYEHSGRMGPLLTYGQIHGQSMREQGGPFVGRAVLTAAVATDPVVLSPKLSLLDRIEVAKYAGGNDFGWARASVGLVYQPHPALALGIFGVQASSAGQPDFTVDQLDYKDGVHLRADLNLGPTKFRYLTKRDSRLGWYDQEFYVSQVVGCLEVFVISRKVPSEYKFGFKLRVDQFVDLLQRKKFDRNPAETRKVVIQ